MVFPEYGAKELAALAGSAAAGDLMGSIHAASARVDQANTLMSQLSNQYGVYILGGSAPVFLDDKLVNRAAFFAPSGMVDHQDKQIMTRFERDDWGVAGGGALKLFDTTLGKIGVLICYDSEFPLLGRTLAEAGAEILLVPSCTEALEGYWRVRIGAMARALENQCVSVMSSLVGPAPGLFGVETNTGMGAVFGPPDRGFPPTGVIAEGTLNQSGWTYADIDLAHIREVRADGNVLNMAHWPEQTPRIPSIVQTSLR